jgi:hypothetical protein
MTASSPGLRTQVGTAPKRARADRRLASSSGDTSCVVPRCTLPGPVCAAHLPHLRFMKYECEARAEGRLAPEPPGVAA